MAEVEEAQRRDGAIPAYPDVQWTCSTGIAQYAGIWYRMGNQTCADRARTTFRIKAEPRVVQPFENWMHEVPLYS